MGTVKLSQVVPSGYVKVTLASNNINVGAPSYAYVYAGSDSATFTSLTGNVTSTQVATITATNGTYTQTGTLTVQPLVVSSVVLSPNSLVGAGTSTATVTLNGPVPAGNSLRINLSSNSVSATVPANIFIPVGQTTGTFTVTAAQVSTLTTATIKASIAGGFATAALTLNPFTISSLSVNPGTVVATSSSTGTVTLNGPAPAAGIVVGLSSNSVAATVPASVTVTSGNSSANFTITTAQVASSANATITTTLGASTKTAALTVNPLYASSVTLTPSTITGGNSVSGSITLTGPAPTGGLSVGLTSSSASATGPATVTVAAGQTTASFTVTTSNVGSSTTSTITATSAGGSSTATLSIIPLAVSSLTFSSMTINSSATTGTVTLNGPAPTGGSVVTIVNQWPTFVSAPSTITIPAGQTSGTFTASTSQMFQIPFTTDFTAQLNGSSVKTTISVASYALGSVSLAASTVPVGTGTTGTVTLVGPAPAGGWTVTLAAIPSTYVTVPANVTVAAGQTTATFPITTSSSDPTTGNVTIQGHDSVIFKAATLTLNSDSIKTFTLSQSVVGNGGVSTGTVTLNSAAPAGGWTVNITEGVSSVFTVPASITIPPGQTVGTFTITGKASGQVITGIAVRVSDSRSTLTQTIDYQGRLISSVSLSPSTVTGGAGSTGTVTLNSAAPTGGWLVNLSTGAPSLAGVPATVLIPAGQTSATFAITTQLVGPQTQVSIIAQDGNSNKSALLTINH